MKRVTLIMAAILSMHSHATAPAMLTAFDDQTQDLRWRTVNDNVMGGRSRGGFDVDDGVLIFAGSTNTNGGGFSSIRSRSRDLVVDESSEGLQMRIRGDGRTYTFLLEADNTRATYWAFFPTVENEWVELRIPFTEFWPNWRGMRLPGPALSKPAINSLGLMIYDKKDGAFRLELEWIKSY